MTEIKTDVTNITIEDLQKEYVFSKYDMNFIRHFREYFFELHKLRECIKKHMGLRSVYLVPEVYVSPKTVHGEGGALNAVLYVAIDSAMDNLGDSVLYHGRYIQKEVELYDEMVNDFSSLKLKPMFNIFICFKQDLTYH